MNLSLPEPLLPAASDRPLESVSHPGTSTVGEQTANPPQTPAVKVPPSSRSQTHPTPWREFFTAFLTIFLAELGDKTQLATLLITAESQAPWVVFAGAALALIATSLLGVLVGRWLASRLAPSVLQTATGVSLLGIAVWLLWDVVHL